MREPKLFPTKIICAPFFTCSLLGAAGLNANKATPTTAMVANIILFMLFFMFIFYIDVCDE